jgi:hypothetical protein
MVRAVQLPVYMAIPMILSFFVFLAVVGGVASGTVASASGLLALLLVAGFGAAMLAGTSRFIESME